MAERNLLPNIGDCLGTWDDDSSHSLCKAIFGKCNSIHETTHLYAILLMKYNIIIIFDDMQYTENNEREIIVQTYIKIYR